MQKFLPIPNDQPRHADTPAARARRSELARTGRYLPNTEDLLLGIPFFRGRLQSDLAVFCLRLLRRRRHEYGPELAALLEALTVEDIWPNSAELRQVIERLSLLREEVRRNNAAYWSLREIILRFQIYLLFSGGPEFLPTVLLELRQHTRASSPLRRWLALRQILAVGMMAGNGAMSGPGHDPWEIAGEAELAIKTVFPEIVEMATGQSAIDDAGPAGRDGGSERGGVVVLQDIGSRDTDSGRRVMAAWQDMVGATVPLAQIPDLPPVRSRLRSRFPHAYELIDKVLGEIASASSETITMPPLILSGPPGCGKTEFAMELIGQLGLPSALYNCGGVNDSAIGGSARHWSTGQPALPVDLIRRHKIANPGIVLDEIEKAGSGHHNGNLLDTLLGLLEPSSARQYHDPYLQAPIDLSHIIWIATSNDVRRLPSPLRDRCRIHAFPVPAPEHLPVLAVSCLERIRADRRLDRNWCPDLAPDEIEALMTAWSGGSIRKLRRLVEGVVRARELAAGMQ